MDQYYNYSLPNDASTDNTDTIAVMLNIFSSESITEGNFFFQSLPPFRINKLMSQVGLSLPSGSRNPNNRVLSLPSRDYTETIDWPCSSETYFFPVKLADKLPSNFNRTKYLPCWTRRRNLLLYIYSFLGIILVSWFLRVWLYFLWVVLHTVWPCLVTAAERWKIVDTKNSSILLCRKTSFKRVLTIAIAIAFYNNGRQQILLTDIDCFIS